MAQVFSSIVYEHAASAEWEMVDAVEALGNSYRLGEVAIDTIIDGKLLRTFPGVIVASGTPSKYPSASPGETSYEVR